jgi:predicted HicB family RNase H-like nuclease
VTLEGGDMQNVEKYAYRLIWSEDDQEYVGLCAEFPSLSWLAPSREEALSGITGLVAEVVAEMTKSKEPVPEALSLQKFKGKLSVRIPPEQHRALVLEAAEQGVSVNRLVSRKLA